MLHNFINYMPSSWIMFGISIMILLFCFTRRNNNFFDIRSIFRHHFSIFNGNKFQLFVFYFVPLMLAFGTLEIKTIDKDVISNINIVLAIFISMFFAMISILYNVPLKKDVNDDRNKKLLNETINTILFGCVLSIILLIVSFIVLFADNYSLSWAIFIVSLLIYYLLFVIVLNIFIIIKRVKKLFDNS